MIIKAGWREIVHDELYDQIPEKIEDLVRGNDYLWSLIKVIKNTPMTVNYNFDDTLQRMIAYNKTDDKSRGSTTLWNKNIYMYPKTSVLYHPNGYLPYKISEHPSESIVFQEDSFADQLIDSINGHYNVLLDYFTHNTCLLIGLSLSDPTLKHILRNNAINYPGTFHYYVKYSPDRNDDIYEKTQTLANFDVYNLITLYLNKEEIGALLDLLVMDEMDFIHYLEEIGKPRSYQFFLVGAVGAGKTTALSYFRGLKTIDEWTDNMPDEMAKDPSKVSEQSKIETIDSWIINQWYIKNNALLDSAKKTNITIIDRGPLDMLAFTPKGKWKEKGEMIMKGISPRRANRKLCSAEVIFLKGDPAIMAARSILIQRDTDASKVQKQQELIEYIYSYAGNALKTIDTRNKGKDEVARAIARTIFLEEYEEAPLHCMLTSVIDGTINEPSRLLSE